MRIIFSFMCRFSQRAPGLWRAREMVFFCCCLAQFLSTRSGTLSGCPAFTSYLFSLQVGNLVSYMAVILTGEVWLLNLKQEKKILSILANEISLWVKSVFFLWSIIALTLFHMPLVPMLLRCSTRLLDILYPFVPLFQIWPDSTMAVGGLCGFSFGKITPETPSPWAAHIYLDSKHNTLVGRHGRSLCIGTSLWRPTTLEHKQSLLRVSRPSSHPLPAEDLQCTGGTRALHKPLIWLTCSVIIFLWALPPHFTRFIMLIEKVNVCITFPCPMKLMLHISSVKNITLENRFGVTFFFRAAYMLSMKKNPNSFQFSNHTALQAGSQKRNVFISYNNFVRPSLAVLVNESLLHIGHQLLPLIEYSQGKHPPLL